MLMRCVCLCAFWRVAFRKSLAFISSISLVQFKYDRMYSVLRIRSKRKVGGSDVGIEARLRKHDKLRWERMPGTM